MGCKIFLNALLTKLHSQRCRLRPYAMRNHRGSTRVHRPRRPRAGGIAYHIYALVLQRCKAAAAAAAALGSMSSMSLEKRFHAAKQNHCSIPVHDEAPKAKDCTCEVMLHFGSILS